MDWFRLILAGLELMNKIADWALRLKYISEGQMLQLAKAQAENLRKSQYGKQAMEEARAMSDSDLDRGLRDFEPGDPDRK